MKLKDKIAATLLNHSSACYIVLILILFLSVFYAFMSMPLQVGDTDIWYHLSGGRYYAAHGGPAKSSYFSFIEPQRLRSNYFWLFQTIVYKVYSLVGEQGLITFRAAAFVLILSLVLFNLYKRQKENLSYITFLTIVYAVVLMARCSVLRPHAFSYALIAAFIATLEYYPKRAFILPVLALLWVNVHGIEYPVMLLILIAYSAEPFIARIRQRGATSAALTLPLVISMAMIFVTPNGLGLIETPFIPTNFASTYINELRQVSIKDLIALFVLPLRPNMSMFTSVLLLIAFISFTGGVIKRTIKIHHAVLFIGAAVLLLRGARFTFEFVLLVLPVIANGNPFTNAKCVGESRFRATYLAVNAAVLAMALFISDGYLSDTKRESNALPRGVTKFLAGLEAGGNLLSTPNYAGYTQWMLYPKYKIFMDMEVPHLFNDVDMYISTNMFRDDIILKGVIDKYNPPFLSVPIAYRDFTTLIKKHPDYAPIFFDDNEALYVNKKTYSQIAAQYELKYVDPFTLGADLEDQKVNDNYTVELKRIFDIWPNMLSAQALAHMYNEKKQFKEALPYTDIAIEKFPDVPAPYNIKAETLTGLGSYAEAVMVLNVALSKAKEFEKQGIYHQLYACYFKLGQRKKAYDALKKSLDVYSPKSSYEDIYNLAALSIVYGKPTDAATLFNIALLKTPPEREDLIAQINKALAALKK
ncbi:MAG: hypothetical protein L7F77_03565 [Candidatus Magnetominusculus sp. LBB02]|nr:hypothetical protein [Candidatus Magnetominusculus sp. LBB02]